LFDKVRALFWSSARISMRQTVLAAIISGGIAGRRNI
jgi:hypothetical protein